MKRQFRFILGISLIVVISAVYSACSVEDRPEPVVIAISKANPGESYKAYVKWLMAADSTIKVIDLYPLPLDSALIIIDHCSGLLLTGGPDIHPGFYGRPQDTSLCDDGIDGKRDTLELMLISRALEADIPILGICRGMQVLNVALGGGLYADIPNFLPSDLRHRCLDKNNCYHEITIMEGSRLFEICKQNTEMVNSNHHQGISTIADNLVGIASTKDSLIEAIQWEYPDNKAFLLAVQWHPERMDYGHPLSLPIAMSFINAAYKKDAENKAANNK